MKTYAVNYLISSRDQVTCLTYDFSIANAILQSYNAPLTSDQIHKQRMYSGKIIQWYFHHLKLRPLLSVLENAEGNYYIRTLEGHLIHAKLEDIRIIAE